MTESKYHLANVWKTHQMSPYNAWVTYDKATGLAQANPARTKICIYGAGYGKQEAPLDDPSWMVWALNLVPPYDSGKRFRADVWWDIHQKIAQTEDDMKWIAECPFPIYVPPDLEDSSPNAIHFPLEEIEQFFGISYWTCTFAYQIAMAMYMGATDIGLYGVELAYGTARERSVEFACVSYWLGRAAERRVRIHTPQVSCLAAHHAGRYGFEYTQELNGVKEYVKTMRDADRYRFNEEGMGG